MMVGTVLVVEDEPLILLDVETALQTLGVTNRMLVRSGGLTWPVKSGNFSRDRS